MTPGNPPIHKTVNSSSAKASLAKNKWDPTDAVAHRLCPDGHDLPPCPCPPASSSIIHVSGGICAPQRAASPSSTVERAGLLRARPGHFLPCAHLPAAEAGAGGPRVIARHYIDKICCPRYGHLAGRSLRAAGRHATCKLAEVVEVGRRRGCRRKRMQMEKRWKAGGGTAG